ncbi:MAG: ABC transporter substrate-binding protein [Actinomycetota bacterium]|nr:ABC transporter substrate-binding protein [Actinomycetota bacterium]
MRIVSLLPSATEIVYALGLDGQLLGVTDECDFPPAAMTKPVVVRARQPGGLTAGEIDAWVSEQAALDGLYRLDDAALSAIAPDLVLTQDLCRVCAVPTADVDAALQRVGCPSSVVTLEPQTLAEVLDSVLTVASAAGIAARGRQLRLALQQRLDAVAAAVHDRPPVPTLVLEWLDPPYTAGHWIPDLVTAAGGTAALGTAGGRSRAIDWATVAEQRAEVVVLAPCGTDPADTWRQSGLVPDDLLPARTFAADLARPGPRLVDCVEALAAVLHPDAGLPERPDVLMPRPLSLTPRSLSLMPRSLSDTAGTLER